MFQMIVCCL